MESPQLTDEEKARLELNTYLELTKVRIPEEKRADFLRHIQADAALIAKDYILNDGMRSGECYFVFMADEKADFVMKCIINLKRKVKAPENLEFLLYTKVEEIPDYANLRKIWQQRVDFYKGENYPDNHYMLRGRLSNNTDRRAFIHVDKIRGRLLGKSTPFKINIDEQYCDDIYVKIGRKYEITLDGKTVSYKD